MTQYLGVEALTGRILFGVGRPDPSDFSGTPDLRPFPREGVVYMSWQGALALGDPPTPSSLCVWTDGAPVWVEAAPLEELKAKKNAEINQWRAAANQSTFPHGGKLIACDALSRSDIDAVANHIGLFGTFPEGFPMAWKATDNTFVPLPDVDAFKTMYASMTAQGTANFERSQELKSALGNATTAAAVSAITWQPISPA